MYLNNRKMKNYSPSTVQVFKRVLKHIFYTPKIFGYYYIIEVITKSK